MIGVIPRAATVAALAAAALLVTSCADTTSGNPTGAPLSPQRTPPTSGSAPSAFPSQPVATASGVAPSSAKASASTWSLSTARQKYLQFVAPYNGHVQALNNLIGNKKATVTSYRSVCAQLASDEQAFVTNLRDSPWPDSAKVPIGAFLPQLEATITAYDKCSGATTTDEARSAINSAPQTQQYANRVREALGLPKAK